MPLALCIVGCGGYARQVLEHIHDMADELTLYYASRDEVKAREFHNTFGGAGYFGSYEKAAADPRVEAMYFLTPHHLHLEGARLAARHGKHVLMEKPIARTIPEATELIGATREAGVTLMVAENYRFVPTIDKCKELIEQGEIGDIRLIQVQREMYGQLSEWRLDVALVGGGIFVDAGIHDVDALLNIGGFPHSVYAARPAQRVGEGEDAIVVTALLPGGAVGLIYYSSATPIKGQRNFLHVTGSKGELRFQPFGSEVVLETLDGRRSFQLPEARMGVRGMVREFRAAIREGREPVMSGEEGLKDLAVVLAAYESAESGRAVSVELPAGGTKS